MKRLIKTFALLCLLLSIHSLQAQPSPSSNKKGAFLKIDQPQTIEPNSSVNFGSIKGRLAHHFELYDADGRLVRSGLMARGQRLNTIGLEDGIYAIVLFDLKDALIHHSRVRIENN